MTKFYLSSITSSLTVLIIYVSLLILSSYISYFINFLEFNLPSNNNTTITNSTYTNGTSTNFECNYFGNFGDNFLFNQFFYCLISFFFRDFFPHIYVYMKVGISNPVQSSRSSSFIEEF